MPKLKKNYLPILRVLLPLFGIYLFAVLVRVWFIGDGSFVFGYDQARDAVYAREILSGNLKLFGPTASGTGDTIFHGVIYYYFLAFLHLFVEDPIHIGYMIAAITAGSVFPIFFLTRLYTKNNAVSLFASFLSAVSYEQILSGTWISNPALIVLLLPIFIYFLTRLMQEFSLKHMFFSMFFLGMCVQFLLFKIYWLLIPAAFFIYDLYRNEWRFRQERIKIWLIGLVTFTATISSMILAEAIMIHRGILNLQSLESFNTGGAGTPFNLLTNIVASWIDKVSDSFSPRIGLFLFLATIGYSLFFKLERKVSYLWIFFITPPIFLLLYYRNSRHMFIGYETLIFVLIAIVVFNILKNISVTWVKTSVIGSAILLFSFFNIWSLSQIKDTHNYPISVQKGFLYSDQIKLLNKTYEIANGEEFSISTLANPYKVNVTWGYLYDYLDRSRYGYKPTFYGPDQTGWAGDYLLSYTEQPKQLHFAIIEPDTGLNQVWIDEFLQDQEIKAGSISGTVQFADLMLLQFEGKK